MPKITSKPSNDDSFKRGFKARSERIALEYRFNIGLQEHDPLPAFKLAAHLNIEVISPADIPGISASCLDNLFSQESSSHWSAVTIGDGKPQMIIHNTSHSPVRIESNIMHECAHIILEHEMIEIDDSYGIPLRKYDLQQEKEAEWLGACLQLPQPALVKWHIYKGYSIDQLSQLFNASAQMVTYRIGVSGVSSLKKRLGK